jgi:hypothetical protein
MQSNYSGNLGRATSPAICVFGFDFGGHRMKGSIRVIIISFTLMGTMRAIIN